MSSLFSIFKKIDTELGNMIINAYCDTQRVQYQAPRLERDNSRLNKRGKF